MAWLRHLPPSAEISTESVCAVILFKHLMTPYNTHTQTHTQREPDRRMRQYLVAMTSGALLWTFKQPTPANHSQGGQGIPVSVYLGDFKSWRCSLIHGHETSQWAPGLRHTKGTPFSPQHPSTLLSAVLHFLHLIEFNFNSVGNVTTADPHWPDFYPDALPICTKSAKENANEYTFPSTTVRPICLIGSIKPQQKQRVQQDDVIKRASVSFRQDVSSL